MHATVHPAPAPPLRTTQNAQLCTAAARRQQGRLRHLLNAIVWRCRRRLLDAPTAQRGDLDGYAPLACAAIGGSVDCIELMLAYGADVGAASSCGGSTALGVACERRHWACAVALLEAGASPACCGATGTAPLVAAAACDRSDVVALLLAKGAAVNAVSVRRSPAATRRRVTALLAAQTAKHADTVALLEGHGAAVVSSLLADEDEQPPPPPPPPRPAVEVEPARPLSPDSAVLAAVASRDVRAMARALDGGGAVQARQADGRTALSLAAAAADIDIVRLLLKRGADPMARDTGTWSHALAHGVRAGHHGTVRVLLEAGADGLARERRPGADKGHDDGDGPSPLAFAVRSGDDVLLALLAARAGPEAMPEIRAELARGA